MNDHGYICQQQPTGKIYYFFHAFFFMFSVCSDGYIFNQHTSKCYKYNPKTRESENEKEDKSQTECKRKGGNLASFEDDQTKIFLQNLMKNSSKADIIDYQNGNISVLNNTISEFINDNEKGYICQHEPKGVVCDVGWTLFEAKCFKFVPKKREWRAAKKLCQSQGYARVRLCLTRVRLDFVTILNRILKLKSFSLGQVSLL